MTRDDDLDVGDLLTIDVAAEVRKLGAAQLGGAWAVPIELVRRALRDGATRVDVTLGRRALEIRASGGRNPGPEPLRRLHVLLDPDAAAADRHRALLELEAAGETGFLALAGLGPRAVHESDGTLIVEGIAFERREAARALESACRFTPATVTIDGTVLATADSGGFRDPMARAPLEAPLSGEVALSREGDDATVWVVLDGVVAAHRAIPDVPPFEACVRRSTHEAGPEANGASLREELEPHLASLVDQAVRLALAGVRDFARRTEDEQHRLRTLLVTAARKRLPRAPDAARAAVFPALAGETGARRWLSLDAMAAAAGRKTGEDARTVLALFPANDPAEYALPAEPVFLLDAAERGRIAQILGIGFASPPKRAGAASRLDRLREIAARIRRAAGVFARRIRHPFAGAPLEDVDLQPAELTLLRALRAALAPGEVHMCEGKGPARHADGGMRLLRHDPLVRGCVNAVSRDPAWVYPAVLALLDGTPPVVDLSRVRSAYLARR